MSGCRLRNFYHQIPIFGIQPQNNNHGTRICAQCSISGKLSMINNSIATSSGRGYARDNYVVPDVAAPGVDVSTPFGERSGSSVSAAITAGACAQLWNGQLSIAMTFW